MGRIKDIAIQLADQGYATTTNLADALAVLQMLEENYGNTDDEDDDDAPPEEFKPQTTSALDDVLDARSVYGSFKDKAEWIQAGKLACRGTPSWNEISAAEKEALDNILQKMGRILFGTEYVADNYTDIAGYSTLVVKGD